MFDDMNIQAKISLIIDQQQVLKRISELQQLIDKHSVNLKINIDRNAQTQLQGIQKQFVGFNYTPTNYAPVKEGSNIFRQQAEAIKSASSETAAYKVAISETGSAINEMSDSAVSSIQAVGSALAAKYIMTALKAIKDVIVECSRAATEFESALAGVRKTSGFTTVEMKSLKDELQALALQVPLTTTELSRIAEVGGQLNVAKENIIDFTRVMADLSVTTSMTGEESADFMARFSNIVQMDMGNWDRFASALVALGNSFAGTESEISAMALRLASAGKQANMTEADTLGLAAALVNVGIKAEMGGSALSKTLNRINIAVNTQNSELADFARVAGMSVDQFVHAFNNDASSALIAFVEGLGDIERHGKNTIVLMDELGLTELRMSDALRRAAGSGEVFRRAIETSNQAFSKNTALQEESAIRYQTTESQLQMLSNSFTQLKVSIGDALAPMIKSIAGALTTVTSGLAGFFEKNQWIVKTLTPLVAVLGTVVAGMTAYATITKAIKVIELDKHFAKIVDGFKSLGKPNIQGFLGSCRIYHRDSGCPSVSANVCTRGLLDYLADFRLARGANWCAA